ncbi:MAG: sulfite exporter TauE/SafE family protein [Burkholderiales bacterium]|nr:sulfite exporter TauE/SafE family protein [Burkholderiales bacterium]
MTSVQLLILGGAFTGGFVSGLTGFGTGLTALPFWLAAVTPQFAAPLVMACSLVAQLQTLPAIWHAIDFKRVRPFVLGGLAGVPFGAYLLPYVPVAAFKAGVGLLLIAYCSFLLIGQLRFKLTWGGAIADGMIGLGGGILGGVAGLSGPLPTIWAGLRGWGKDAKRGVFQVFNLSILAFALVSQSVAGLINADWGRLFLLALPGTLAGAWLGRRLYARLSDRRFDNAILILLLISGVSLLRSAFR